MTEPPTEGLPRPLDVTAFTQGRDVPSARFRVRQYIPALAALGINVRESFATSGSYPPASPAKRPAWLAGTLGERSVAAASRRSAVTWLQREMVSTLALPDRLTARPRVLDVDDAIWLSQRLRSVDRLARTCKTIICGNTVIADYFSQFAPVEVVPTGLDTSRWRPCDVPESVGEEVIVWSGSSSGLPYLEAIQGSLAAVMAQEKSIRLRVVSDCAPTLARLDPTRVDWVRWSPESEVKAIQSASVGLMPLPSTPWTQAKCSFKLLTYLACGVPAVANPVGMNADVIVAGGAMAATTPEQWVEAILHLLHDPSARLRDGAVGRANVVANYSLLALAPKLARILQDAGRD